MNCRKVLGSLVAVAVSTSPAFASGGSGGGGGGVGVTSPSPLPSTPPAPDVILRESFGPGLDGVFQRPQGGNGSPRSVFAGASLSGFWLEYPGSKSVQWSTPDVGPGWHYAFASLNPYETLPSPIQPDPYNGIAFSEWRDGIVAFPDALIPFRGAASKYSVSAEMYPGGFDTTYVAIGLTGSGALQSNLPSSGQIWILLSQAAPFTGGNGHYEVRSGTTVLASGDTLVEGFTRVSITVDPVAQTVSVSLYGVELGTWAARINPSYIALEGQGWVDDVVVRLVP
jgi:hypothetical protein